jgi:nicotinamide-nucleotide amidase
MAMASSQALGRLGLLHGLAVGFAAQRCNARIMLAESCTGGLASHWITRIGGSSHWFDGAVVCYSNRVKSHLALVPRETLNSHGAVSAETARALAQGIRAQHALALEGATEHQPFALFSAAITGIAGPGGATPGKPVGTVFFAWSGPKGTRSQRHQFAGDRLEIQAQAAAWACAGLFAALIGAGADRPA